MNRRISQDLKFRLIKCFIYSVFTYGCETWTLTRDMENKINSFEMWIFRKVAKIKWSDRISNEEVCKKLNVEKSLLNDIKKRKLCYFGHIKRHSSIKKEILEGKIEGKRGRGRPPRKWEDDVKAWTEMDLYNCTRAAENRDVWRNLARQPRHP